MAGFGSTFTAHMVVRTWTSEDGWGPPEVRPYGPFQLQPATAVLHYGQEIFEGLKAFRHPDGEIRVFRPEANAARMRRSARRMGLPELPESDFLQALELLLTADSAAVSSAAVPPEAVPPRRCPRGGESLYLRPFMFASEPFLGVRPAREATFCVFGSPTAAYFDDAGGITLWLTDTYARAGAGGTGDVKCGGNYAASLLPQDEAQRNGCAQSVFVDPDGYVQETGASALFLVIDGDGDGAGPTLVTPVLDGAVMASISRDSVLRLARDLGTGVSERPVHIDEWRRGAAEGWIAEAFACGSAAAVTPVRGLRWNGGERQWGTGPVAARVADALSGIQQGRAPDPYGWLRRVGGSAAWTPSGIGTVPL